MGGTGDDVGTGRKPIAVFWGILDLKYDSEQPEGRTVQVLELGDGRTSRFSHHGNAIKDVFYSDYYMDSNPIKRAVLVENKRVTHDIFQMTGFRHLRPPTVCFQRHYTPDLAGRIVQELGAEKGEVVLKLCNRARGAGVVIARASELDNVLKRLLNPPQGSELDQWLASRLSAALEQTYAESLDEQCIHWWSNECPVFIAELCCHSQIVADPATGIGFDATLRVSFALLRKDPVTWDDSGPTVDDDTFLVGWLGGYWKLPPAAATEQGNETLDDIRARLVSSFNSAEKRTAEVAKHDLHSVYSILEPAVIQIFRASNASIQNLRSTYKPDPCFCAFSVARAAAAIRVPTKLKKAEDLFKLTWDVLSSPLGSIQPSLPYHAVTSYIYRNIAVCEIMQKDRKKAKIMLQRALENLPTNANAYYTQGQLLIDQGEYAEALVSLTRAVLLDPDFKLPYVCLGNCQLHLGNHEEAIKAAKACMSRFPDAPMADFIIGQALYHMIQDGKIEEGELQEKSKIAADSLRRAKKRLPIAWLQKDDRFLEYFEKDEEVRTTLPRQPVHTWKVFGWRP